MWVANPGIFSDPAFFLFVKFKAFLDEMELPFFFQSVVAGSRSAFSAFAASAARRAANTLSLDIVEVVNFDCF